MQRIEDAVPPGELPPATLIRDQQTPIDKIVANWIRWLPASICFFGLAFVAWTIIMVVSIGHYHDELTKVDQRVKVLEKKLQETQDQYDVEYWSRQCIGDWGKELWKEHEQSCHNVEP